jgi:uncharacterized membrane protein HdeD (DUF308 family)
MLEDHSDNDQSGDTRAPAGRGQNWWVGGAILIAIGVIFLIQNLTGGFVFRNWWAIFIAFPGLAALANAWRVYRAGGRLTREARRSLFGGLFLLTIAAVFVFDLNWGAIWPVFLIIWGVGLLFDSMAR